jgi:hypothetical protein
MRCFIYQSWGWIIEIWATSRNEADELVKQKAKDAEFKGVFSYSVS